MAIRCVFYFVFVTLFLSLLLTPLAPISFVLAGLPGLFHWLEGWQLVRSRLERQNAQLVKIVEADSEESAIARYLAVPTEKESGFRNTLKTVPPVADESPRRSSTASQMFGFSGAREARRCGWRRRPR